MGMSQELTVTLVLALIVVNIICGGFASFVASTKGREGVSWFLLGCLFGFIALVAVGLAEPIDRARQLREERDRLNEEQDRLNEEQDRLNEEQDRREREMWREEQAEREERDRLNE